MEISHKSTLLYLLYNVVALQTSLRFGGLRSCSYFSDSTCKLIFSMYSVLPFLSVFICFVFFYLMVLICFQSLCIARMKLWTDTDYHEIQTICFLTRQRGIDVNIVAAILIVLVSHYGCPKKIQTVYTKVMSGCFLCSALIKDLIWSWLQCIAYFLCWRSSISRLACYTSH